MVISTAHSSVKLGTGISLFVIFYTVSALAMWLSRAIGGYDAEVPARVYLVMPYVLGWTVASSSFMECAGSPPLQRLTLVAVLPVLGVLLHFAAVSLSLFPSGISFPSAAAILVFYFIFAVVAGTVMVLLKWLRPSSSTLGRANSRE